MAQDIKLQKNDDGIYDIPFNESGNDLAEVQGIETSLIVSLFTNARASSGNVPESFRRRGWCGNILTKSENYELGSLLWTLNQSRLNRSTLNLSEDICKKALQFMVNDRIADTIEVVSEEISERACKITIILYRENNEVARYSTIWLATKQFIG